MSHVEYPLSPLDIYAGEITATLGYVLSKPEKEPYDTTPLLDAAERVAKKWPLLAARVVKHPKTGQFLVRTPTGDLPSEIAKFTMTMYDVELNHTPPASSATKTTKRPPLKYFRHSSVPYRLPSYASQSHPLFSIHVSHFRDATCIGFTCPHGVFDANGGTLVLQALMAELAGREWTPPPIMKKNILTDILAELPVEESEAIAYFREYWPKIALGGIFWYLLGILYEIFWCSLETKAMYLDNKAASAIVGPAKKEAEALGQWVSTGDILLAWFLKTALSSEKSKSGFALVNSSVCLRKALAEKNPLMKAYPHNAIVVSPMKPISLSKLDTMSVAELAILHRKHLFEVSKPSFIGALSEYFGQPTSTPLTPSFRFDTAQFTYTNKVMSNLALPNFGGGTRVIAFWEWISMIDPDHIVNIHKFDDGYTIVSGMRKYRWEAVEGALRKLQALD